MRVASIDALTADCLEDIGCRLGWGGGDCSDEAAATAPK